MRFTVVLRYLNRVGSRTARPARPNREIGHSACTPSLELSEELSGFDVVRVICCAILVLTSMLEAGELLALRIREVFTRTLFGG